MSIIKRLKEPSTWAGFAVFFQMAKAFVKPEYHVLLDGLAGVSASAAVVRGERGAPQAAK